MTTKTTTAKSAKTARKAAKTLPLNLRKCSKPGAANSVQNLHQPAKAPILSGREAVEALKAKTPAKGEKMVVLNLHHQSNAQKRLSGLDAAAKVLAEAKGPLNAQAMVEAMLAKGYWKTGGKTPAATIYAAIIREIAAKGTKARFKKTDRGLFTVNN